MSDMPSISVSVEVFLDDLVLQLVHNSCGWRELVDIVKAIDEKAGMWDFTLAMADYFAGLKEEHAKEEAAEAAKRKTVCQWCGGGLPDRHKTWCRGRPGIDWPEPQSSLRPEPQTAESPSHEQQATEGESRPPRSPGGSTGG